MENVAQTGNGVEPITQTVDTASVDTTTQNTEDLITKVSQFKETLDKTQVPQTQGEGFDIRDIDKIEDPQAREYALQAFKSFQRGFDKKFQDLAKLRKEYEETLKNGGNGQWTAEKIQNLLNDPQFVQAAQQVAGNSQQDDYSALSEAEKQKLQEVDMQIKNLQSQNAQLLKRQQDERLTQRYANYNSEAVDVLTADLLSGKVQATREHLHKVLDYEDAVNRAYKMGLQDRQAGMSDRISSMSTDGLNVVNGERLQPEKGESSLNYLRRIFDKNKKLHQNSQIRK